MRKLSKIAESVAQGLVEEPDISAEALADKLGKKEKKDVKAIRSYMNRPTILERVELLRKEKIGADILTGDETLKILSDIVKNEKEQATNRIKAAEALIKLRATGGHVPYSGEGLPDNIVQPVIIQIPSNNR